MPSRKPRDVGDALEGTDRPSEPYECEYCVVIAITNEQGEKIARHVVGVGALAARRAP
jgi:hypothetical protein